LAEFPKLRRSVTQNPALGRPIICGLFLFGGSCSSRNQIAVNRQSLHLTVNLGLSRMPETKMAHRGYLQAIDFTGRGERI
jgi:hypothetical protein